MESIEISVLLLLYEQYKYIIKHINNLDINGIDKKRYINEMNNIYNKNKKYIREYIENNKDRENIKENLLIIISTHFIWNISNMCKNMYIFDLSKDTLQYVEELNTKRINVFYDNEYNNM